MKKFRLRLSLRYKLLFVLTSLPSICLALYMLMATDLFQKYMVSYVYDSSVTVSRSVATQTRIELQALFDSLRPICESFDPVKRDFSDLGKLLFTKHPHVRALVLFEKNPAGGFDQIGSLTRDPQRDQEFVNHKSTIESLRSEVASQISYMTELPSFPGSVGISFRVGEANDPHGAVVVVLYSSEDLMNNFENTDSLYRTFLAKKTGDVVIGYKHSLGLEGLTHRLNSPIPEGTAEMKGQDGQAYLVSYASTGFGDLMVVSAVNKKSALKAVEVLIIKSIVFFIALIASTVIVSVIASGRLTAQLRELYEATGKIAQGDFDVRVDNRSGDEIGGLAESFTYMAQEVKRLMSETAQKARMENELATVKTVQETLFPPAVSQFGPIEVVGHFEPASECGGDWWSYSRVGERVFLWIGDATGHGAPAALITSAARSAASVIEMIPDVSPSMGLRIMNHAIHETSKGKINMTFFLASLNLTTGEFSYANASHDPPYLMRRKAGAPLGRKDLVPLMESNGPRLGEQPDVVFQETTLQLSPGDLIFFYTDGIMDIQNPKLEKWGERTFLRTLVSAANFNGGIFDKVAQVRKVAMDYRQEADLIDDVTMFMVEYNPAREQRAAS